MDFRYLLNMEFEKMRSVLPEDFEVLAMALESTNSGVVITDNTSEENPIIFCNHAFENLTGYSREEIIGRNCRFLQGKDKEQQALIELRLAIATGNAITIEVKNYRRDGVMFWNELSISPVKNQDGKVTHYIGVQNDVTRKKLMETELLEQIDLLNRRLEKQDNYINRVENVLSGILMNNQNCFLFLNEKLEVVKANQHFYELFGIGEEEVINVALSKLQDHQWDEPELIFLIKEIFSGKRAFEGFKIRLSDRNLRCQRASVSGRAVTLDGVSKRFALISINCTLTAGSNEEANMPQASFG